ncbi:hypothetical protein E2I00_011201, partial [Balaenoptera physalus]
PVYANVERQPRATSPGAAAAHGPGSPPTPETDYPELLTSYPEEDYSPVGSFGEPGPASPLVTPPGWSCHVSQDGQTLYTNNFTQEQWMRLEDQHGKPYFYNPDDASVQWELPQVPVPAPRSIRKSSQDNETPAQASPPEEKGGILTFFKDSKTSTAGGLRQPSKLSTPEYTVELKGASLAWAPKDKSSKKNVLELRSRDGSEYLIQHDSEAIISTWHKAIAQGIQELKDPQLAQGSASLRLCDSSPQTCPPRRKVRAAAWTLGRVFGCALAVLCERERSQVPRFVQQCIRTVEARGLDIDGLYRISGNLATIQKLRYKVDHDERLDLDDGRWEDVHVITGALKLFFRELPEPLFPFSHFPQFIAAISERLGEVGRMGVIEHGEQNRMSVQSVAIVFGPTLLRPETEETSMPMTMVFQNQVVELILQQCSDVFPPH